MTRQAKLQAIARVLINTNQDNECIAEISRVILDALESL